MKHCKGSVLGRSFRTVPVGKVHKVHRVHGLSQGDLGDLGDVALDQGGGLGP